MKRKFCFRRKESRFAPWLFSLSWEQRKFSEITYPAGEKNKDNLSLESYSITNEKGFVPQDEQFENGGTMRDADKRMYYIVTPFSFAYNPARINVGSIGYHNTLKNVIVSSLYEVFKTSEDVNDRLLWHWFKSPDFRRLIEQLQEGGVRLYFYYDKLCMGAVYLPKIDEQEKIGSLFDTIDRLITLHQRGAKSRTLVRFRRFCSMTIFWEQRKFGETFTFLQNNTLSRADLADSGDGARNIHYGDILVKFGECINIAKASLPIITNESVINKYLSSFLKNGDIVIADTAEDETVGKCAEIIEEKGERIISGLHTIPCRPTCDFAGGFLGYYMNSSAFHDQLIPLMQGIKVTSISKSALQTTMVQYPLERAEQAQIGRMFQLLDGLITLHQREFTHKKTNTNYVK